MAASDELTRLVARAKEAEDRAAAAQGKAKADLEQDVATARASAQAQAEKLRQSADASKGKLSVWWNDMQRSWNEHVAKIREDIDAKRAEHDAERAQRYAENAEDDATFAVDYAYAAIEEAEYAVLDAALARKQADELSRQPGARPPAGGWIESASIPLRAITQAITEFEFHISPVPSSSRPHTGVGTCATTSRRRRARRSSPVRCRGLSTASATSGMCPSRHRRIS